MKIVLEINVNNSDFDTTYGDVSHLLKDVIEDMDNMIFKAEADVSGQPKRFSSYYGYGCVLEVS